MSINKIMNVGKAALAANQSALSTTAHNVANVNTPGFSRQRVNMEAAIPSNEGGVQTGSGVVAGSITRAASPFVNRRIQQESTDLGSYEGMSGIMQQVEAVMQDDGEKGISSSMTKFFNDVRNLSAQPDSQALRTVVQESARSVGNNFNNTSQSLGKIHDDLNRRVESSVAEVNTLTTDIARLNKRVAEIEIAGGQANDERDSRDLAVQKLSKLIDIQEVPGEHGLVGINAGRMGSLVTGFESQGLSAQMEANDAGQGVMKIHLSNGPHMATTDITDSIKSGAIGGYLKARDQVLPEFMNRMDQIAHGFANEVNSIHSQSFSSDGKTGVNLFDVPEGVKGAAQSISLSAMVASNPGNISAGSVPNAAGDNRGLLAIADIQNSKFLDGGKATFNDAYSGLVGRVGAQTKEVSDRFDNQKGLIDQLTNLRDQQAGVSLDEEGIDMVKFQKAFDASAKMIQVADQMMDTVINLKRF